MQALTSSSMQLPSSFRSILSGVAVDMSAGTAPRPKGEPQGRRPGNTLRPGEFTPLWNALRKEIQPHLQRHGEQAKLARILGLHRQAVNAYFTRGSRMPDAERTIQIMAWLMSKSQEASMPREELEPVSR